MRSQLIHLSFCAGQLVVQVPAKATASISHHAQELEHGLLLMPRVTALAWPFQSSHQDTKKKLLWTTSFPHSSCGARTYVPVDTQCACQMAHLVTGVGAMEAMLTCYSAQPGGCQKRLPSR